MICYRKIVLAQTGETMSWVAEFPGSSLEPIYGNTYGVVREKALKSLNIEVDMYGFTKTRVVEYFEGTL